MRISDWSSDVCSSDLSRQIQLLEHQLGVALFTRSTRSVALTAAGRAFFVEAQALLDQAHRAAQGARLAALGESGSLTVSFVASAVYDFLPRATIGRAHVWTPVTNAHLVCRLLLVKKKKITIPKN